MIVSAAQYKILTFPCRLREDEEYADLIIKCQGATYNVHQALVCTRSEFFAAACRWQSAGGYQAPKKRRTAEGISSCGAAADQGSGTKVINLDDDDPVAVWAMVQYLYNLEYPEPTEEVEKKILSGEAQAGSSPSEDKLSEPAEGSCHRAKWHCVYIHAKVYSLGKNYGLSGLKHFAKSRFVAVSKGNPGSVSGLIPVVLEVYTATPEHDRELRDQVRSILCKNMKIVSRPGIQQLMLEMPRVAVDVLMEYYCHNPPRTTASRPSVRPIFP